jgi:hypothetical protein
MGRRRTQHGVWWMAARSTIALGLVCGVGVWGVWGPVSSATAIFTIAFLMAVLLGKRLWTSTRIGFTLALVLIACAGLPAAFGWSGVLLLALVVATSPVVRLMVGTGRLSGVLRQSVAGDSGASPDDPGLRVDSCSAPRGTADGSWRTLALCAEIPDANGVPTLDDHALCQAWRRSYVRLEASRVAEARLEVVRLRQAYLDELVRRHPAQVRHWLASGARAAGNPMPFLERPVSPEWTSEDESDGPASQAS